MTIYVLDTDTVTRQQANHPAVLRRLEQLPPTQIFTTVITLREQIRGRLAVVDRVAEGVQLVKAYQQLQSTTDYFKQVNVLSFTVEAAVRLQQLRDQNIRVGSQDLRIAAIVLSGSGVLVTSNRRDFSRVPGLQIEDWASA
ncbi:MAG: type II toxin-antitoxin system VapC family toxin [Caldilineaceae bacterium]|nr:type II toxin-antitoxin system VapC family toxin [Caldilineaceae bacterium]